MLNGYYEIRIDFDWISYAWSSIGFCTLDAQWFLENTDNNEIGG